MKFVDNLKDTIYYDSVEVVKTIHTYDKRELKSESIDVEKMIEERVKERFIREIFDDEFEGKDIMICFSDLQDNKIDMFTREKRLEAHVTDMSLAVEELRTLDHKGLLQGSPSLRKLVKMNYAMNKLGR